MHNSSALAEYAVRYLLETQQLQVYQFDVIQLSHQKVKYKNYSSLLWKSNTDFDNHSSSTVKYILS